MENNYYQLIEIGVTKKYGEYTIVLRSCLGREVITTAIIDKDGENTLVNFSSDDIGETIMKEYINIKQLCSAITAFHECQKL